MLPFFIFKSLQRASSSAHKEKVVSERAWNLLGPVFAPKNRELYQYLEDYPGPWMEQRPLLSPFPEIY